MSTTLFFEDCDSPEVPRGATCYLLPNAKVAKLQTGGHCDEQYVPEHGIWRSSDTVDTGCEYMPDLHVQLLRVVLYLPSSAMHVETAKTKLQLMSCPHTHAWWQRWQRWQRLSNMGASGLLKA